MITGKQQIRCGREKCREVCENWFVSFCTEETFLHILCEEASTPTLFATRTFSHTIFCFLNFQYLLTKEKELDSGLEINLFLKNILKDTL